MICQLLLHIFLGTPQERANLRAKARAFTERHLIADDPYEKAERELWLREQETKKEEANVRGERDQSDRQDETDSQ